MDRNSQLLVAGVFLAAILGAGAGGFATYTVVGNQAPALDNQSEQSLNLSGVTAEEKNLNELFNRSEESLVYIESFGPENTQGSGFVSSSDGYIVTNQHVVEDSESVQVTFTDGSTLNAEIVGTDQYTDLAVLEVDRDNLEPLSLGDSRSALVGERVVALGSPFGLRGSMTVGYISQKGRQLRVGNGFSIPNVIQTEAAINPGNSGGPLLNTEGEVIGVNTAIQSNTGTFSGVGFAVPSEAVKRVVPELIEEGDYRHSWLGVSGIDMNEELAEKMDAPNTSGFLVINVVEDGPSDEAGIRGGDMQVEIRGGTTRIGGDIIVGIEGQKVRDISDLLSYLSRNTEVGDTVTLKLYREGEYIEKEVTLDARPR